MRLVQNPEVVATEIEGGAVLLNLESRLYYSLNETGLEVWRHAESAAGAEGLGRFVAASFDVDERVAAAAAARLLDELVRAGLLVETNEEVELSAAAEPDRAGGARRPYREPQLIQHDEPLYEVTTTAFDPQLPLAE